jgi:hypothetical protein
MAEEERNIKIKFDSNAVEVTKSTNALGASIDGTEKAAGKANKTTKDGTQAAKESAKATKTQSEALESLNGPIGSAVSGFKAMLKQMVAIVANPLALTLIAIVGALTLLFKAFTSTKAGGEALDRVFSAIGATVDVLRDRFLQLVNGLATLNIKEIIASFTGLGEEIEKDARAAAELTRTLQQVADAQRDLSVSRSKLNRDLAASKELITDETASYADKKKAINEVRIAEEKQTAAELANARKKLKAILDQNDLSDSLGEALQSSADAQRAVYDLETESNNNRRAINKSDKRADNEERARIKTINDEEKARLKIVMDTAAADSKARKALREQEAKDKLELAKQDFKDNQDNINILLALDKENAEKRAVQQKEIDDKQIDEAKKKAATEIEIEKAKADQKKSIQDGQDALLTAGVGFLSKIAGKNRLLQKAAIIAESALGIGRSVVATNASNVAATAAGAALAIPTAGASVAAAAGLVTTNYATLGLGIAGNVLATAKALQALGGGSAPSGAAGANVGGGGAGSGAATPTVAFNNTSENQIGQSVAARQAEQAPIRVFVAESDITDAQADVKVLLAKNTF